MNELYVLLIIGVSTSALVVFSLFLHASSTDIQSVAHNIKYGKSVYEIELVRNNNQFFDIIVDPSTGKVAITPTPTPIVLIASRLDSCSLSSAITKSPRAFQVGHVVTNEFVTMWAHSIRRGINELIHSRRRGFSGARTIVQKVSLPTPSRSPSQLPGAKKRPAPSEASLRSGN